jgi:hypothetical protein
VSFANYLAEIVGPTNTSGSSVTFNVTFPADVAAGTLLANEFSIDTTLTTATGCQAPSNLTGSGTAFTITVSGCSEGNIAIKLVAGAVQLGGFASYETLSNTVAIDRSIPVISVSATTATPSKESSPTKHLPRELSWQVTSR